MAVRLPVEHWPLGIDPDIAALGEQDEQTGILLPSASTFSAPA